MMKECGYQNSDQQSKNGIQRKDCKMKAKAKKWKRAIIMELTCRRMKLYLQVSNLGSCGWCFRRRGFRKHLLSHETTEHVQAPNVVSEAC
jgi:hypothetical protein